MSKRPAIRFKEYTERWKQSELITEVDSVDTGKSKFKSNESGMYEILGSTSVIGYDDSYDYEGNFLLTARVGANAGELYRHSGKVKISDNTVYIQGKQLDFLYYALLHFDIKRLSFGTGQPLIKASELKKQSIFMPISDCEREKLGVIFNNLDIIVTLYQRKYDKLLMYKKAMLEKMFPKDDADVPEVRFAGHTKPWQHLTFGGEIVLPYSDPVATPNGGYERLGIRSHAKGTFHSFVPAGQELETAQMHRVKANNFIVNITFGWEHAVAITDTADEGKLVSHRFPQFSFNQRMVPSFFKYQIIDEKFRHHLWLSSPGGAGRNRVLNINQMLEYRFWVTDEDEQNKIAHFFGRLDEMIELQHEKLTRIKNIKKALLDKMFI